MRRQRTVLLLIAACLAAVVLLTWAAVSGLQADLARRGRKFLHEQRRREALARREEAISQSTAIKRAVTAEVVAGRLRLAEAAQRFRQASALLNDGQDELLGRAAPAEDEQEVYDAVLPWVAVSLRDDPPRQAEVCARLDSERRRHLPRLVPGPQPAHP
jgi:hypothetical protein